MEKAEPADETVDYFSKLMTDGTGPSERSLRLTNDFNIVLTAMLFKLMERCVNKLCKDGKYPEIREMFEKFPDQIVDLWLYRIREQIEKEKKEYSEYTSTDTGKIMGGLFGKMFDVDGHIKSHLKEAEELAENFRASLKVPVKE